MRCLCLQVGLFDFGSRSSPVVLLLDRNDDPVTPLLTQWTYQVCCAYCHTLEQSAQHFAICRVIAACLLTGSRQHPRFFTSRSCCPSTLVKVNSLHLLCCRWFSGHDP